MDTKIVSKSVPRGLFKLLKIIAVFDCLPDPQKIVFLVNMAPTWPDFGPQDDPKLGPKWNRNQTKNGLGSDVGSGADSGSILGRFGVDFGTIFRWFLVDFGSLSGSDF